MLFGFVKSVFQSQEKFLKLGELLRFTLLQRAKEPKRKQFQFGNFNTAQRLSKYA